MTKFYTVNERKTRIAELCAEITANGGTAPTNCDGFKTSTEAKAEIAKMETILAECRAKKASAKPGTPALIACLSEKTTGPTTAAARAAITARLEASKAAVAASAAKLKAQEAVAALKPDPFVDQSDSQLQLIANHRSASDTDRAAAKAALESRGWTVHANGAFSQSITKKPRR